MYYYVREGNILRRIEHYAIEVVRSKELVKYVVPFERISNKTICIYLFSHRGNLCVIECPAEAFLRSKEMWSYDHKLCVKRCDLRELKGLEFELKDPILERIVEDARKYFNVIIKEIKEYSESLGFTIVFGSARSVRTFLEDIELGLIRCLGLPTNERRFKCLDVAFAWIYEIWVIALAAKSIGIQQFKYQYSASSRQTWEIKQGSPYPITYGIRGNQYYAFFLEPQPYAIAHIDPRYLPELVKSKTGRRYIRPDIIINKGMQHRMENPDLLIECKVMPSVLWSKEVSTQLKEYVSLYKPKNTMLVSFHEIVDQSLKRTLESMGVIIIENLKPGEQAIKVFKKSYEIN